MSLDENDKRWIKAELQQVRTDMETGLQQVRTEIERVETTLLTEFHKWASPVEMRQRSHAAALRALDAEVEALSDRVTKLEAS